MADFAVAHLAFGKTDVGPGRVDERVGEFLQQFVIGGFPRQGDGVALCFCAIAPPIKHSKHNWSRSFGHSRSEYTHREATSHTGGTNELQRQPGQSPASAANEEMPRSVRDLNRLMARLSGPVAGGIPNDHAWFFLVIIEDLAYVSKAAARSPDSK